MPRISTPCRCSWASRTSPAPSCTPMNSWRLPNLGRVQLLGDAEGLGSTQLRVQQMLVDAQDLGGVQLLWDAEDLGGTPLRVQEPLVGPRMHSCSRCPGSRRRAAAHGCQGSRRRTTALPEAARGCPGSRRRITARGCPGSRRCMTALPGAARGCRGSRRRTASRLQMSRISAEPSCAPMNGLRMPRTFAEHSCS